VTDVTEQIEEQSEIQETSGEVEETTSGEMDSGIVEQSQEVTDGDIADVDSQIRDKQSEYDRKIALLSKFDTKLSELNQKYPQMDMETSVTQTSQTTQTQADDLDEYITKADLQTFAQQITGKLDEKSTLKQQEDATAFLSETFHGYGFMENGQWLDSEVATGARELARNTAASLNPTTPPAKAAALIKNVVDGYYSKLITAKAVQRAEEKGAQKVAMQKQLARPETASAPAQTKQEVDPDLADLLKARKLSGLG